MQFKIIQIGVMKAVKMIDGYYCTPNICNLQNHLCVVFVFLIQSIIIFSYQSKANFKVIKSSRIVKYLYYVVIISSLIWVATHILKIGDCRLYENATIDLIGFISMISFGIFMASALALFWFLNLILNSFNVSIYKISKIKLYIYYIILFYSDISHHCIHNIYTMGS